MEFLDVSEKLKKLRNDFNVKQRELVDVNITRAFISMIEIGKRIPNKVDAEVIISKFKKKAKELGIEFNFDNEYLLRNASEDAEIYCYKNIDKADSFKELFELLEIAKMYKLTQMLPKIYLKLADKKFDEANFADSEVYYIEALDIYKNTNEDSVIPYIYNKLGRCSLSQVHLIQALNYFRIAYHYAILQDNEDIKQRAIYNIALCNKKIGNIDEALKFINLYISICDKQKDFIIYVYANILKSNCYEIIGKINTSIEILTDLLSNFPSDKDQLLGTIYNNLGCLYSKINLNDLSLHYFKKSQEIRENTDIQNLSHTLIERANISIQHNNNDEAISLLKRGIQLSIKYSDMEYLLKAYYMLGDLYKKLRFYNEVEHTYIELLDYIKALNEAEYKDQIIRICVELSQLYILENNIYKLKKTLDIMEHAVEK